MSKIKFRTSEVLAFVEEKILDNIATEGELELYQDYKWFDKINRDTYVWKNLIREMRDIYENGYK